MTKEEMQKCRNLRDQELYIDAWKEVASIEFKQASFYQLGNIITVEKEKKETYLTRVADLYLESSISYYRVVNLLNNDQLEEKIENLNNVIISCEKAKQALGPLKKNERIGEIESQLNRVRAHLENCKAEKRGYNMDSLLNTPVNSVVNTPDGSKCNTPVRECLGYRSM